MGKQRRVETTDSGATAFLQRRVARYCYVLALIGLVALVFRFAASVIFGYVEAELVNPRFYVHALALTPLVVGWLALRGSPRSKRVVQAFDAFAVIGGSLGFVALGTFLPPSSTGAAPIVAYVATMIYLGRAIYVPSTVRDTLAVGLIIGVVMIATMYAHHLRADPEIWRKFGYVATGRTSTTIAGAIAVQTTMFWTMSMTLAAVATAVIHGLRRQVRDAKKLGQYTLEEKLGEGGMGVVYRATHGMLKRPTAIKLMRDQQRDDPGLKRFHREVQLTASLTHPNTVTIYDYGRTPAGLFYYAMELLDGATLEEIVELDGPQSAQRVSHVLAAAARALHEAHVVGLVHRDIKPSNIMLTRLGGVNDVVKVLDFGLVKRVERDDNVQETHADAIKGTPQYLAPETITDPKTVGPRSDLYALGAVGYYLLSGRHMFEGKTIIEVCSQHLHDKPTPLSVVSPGAVPQELEQILMDCVEKDPAARPSSAESLADQLRSSVETTWTDADADAWWKSFGPELEAYRQDTDRVATDKTIEVDMTRRDKPIT